MLMISKVYKFSSFYDLYQFLLLKYEQDILNLLWNFMKIVFKDVFSLKPIKEQDGTRASMVEFFFKFNKRACLFIKYSRVFYNSERNEFSPSPEDMAKKRAWPHTWEVLDIFSGKSKFEPPRASKFCIKQFFVEVNNW